MTVAVSRLSTHYFIVLARLGYDSSCMLTHWSKTMVDTMIIGLLIEVGRENMVKFSRMRTKNNNIPKSPSYTHTHHIIYRHMSFWSGRDGGFCFYFHFRVLLFSFHCFFTRIVVVVWAFDYPVSYQVASMCVYIYYSANNV